MLFGLQCTLSRVMVDKVEPARLYTFVRCCVLCLHIVGAVFSQCDGDTFLHFAVLLSPLFILSKAVSQHVS